MTIAFNCPNCNKAYKVKDELAGKRATCAGCKKAITVPTASAPAPAEPAPPAAKSSPAPTRKVAAPRPEPDKTNAAGSVPAAGPSDKAAPPTRRMAGPATPPADKASPAARPAAEAPPEPPAPSAPTADTMTFNCPQCDESITVKSNLAGKQAPCPECGRIIKVPVLVREEPKDWRRAMEPRGLAAPPRPDAAPDVNGAWGSATASPASRPTPAGPAPEVKVPLTRAQKLRRLVRWSTAAAVVGLLAWGTWYYFGVWQQTRTMGWALAYVEGAPNKPQLTGEAAAEIHRAAGEFYLRRDDLEEALKQFHKCRARLGETAPPAAETEAGAKQPPRPVKPGKADSDFSNERDAVLIDLALSEIELGGDERQVKKEQRLSWEDAQKELIKTVLMLHAPSARLQAIRVLSRPLIAKGQPQVAVMLARQLDDGPEVAEGLALVGLELLRSGQQNMAETLLADAIQRLPKPPQEPPPPKPEPPKELKPPSKDPDDDKDGAESDEPAPAPAPYQRPMMPPPPPPVQAPPEGRRELVAPSVVALGLALKQNKKIEALQPRAKATPADVAAWRIGYAEGLALQGNLRDVAGYADAHNSILDRLEAAVAVAGAALESRPGDTTLIDKAIRLVESSLKVELDPTKVAQDPGTLQRWRTNFDASWAIYRLVQIAQQAGLTDRARSLAGLMVDPSLRGRAQLDLLRAQLAAAADPVDDNLIAGVDEESPARTLALEAVARHNASHGGSSAALKFIETQPEALRPFGYAGAALGMQKGR